MQSQMECSASGEQVGIPAIVLEREGGLREEGAAITFWPNAFAVLDLLDCAEPLRKSHPLLDRRGPLQQAL
jgi:2-polyprenyl-6-methoxyphenol hydroxylase-like FAD-dependent oxidoreductase